MSVNQASYKRSKESSLKPRKSKVVAPKNESEDYYNKKNILETYKT